MRTGAMRAAKSFARTDWSLLISIITESDGHRLAEVALL